MTAWRQAILAGLPALALAVDAAPVAVPPGSVTALQATLATALGTLAPEDLAGGEARARLLAGLPAAGLDAEARATLAAAIAEAWLDAEDPAAAQAALRGVAAPAAGSLRNRLDLVRIEAWILARRQGEPAADPEPALAGAAPAVRARHLAARAQLALATAGKAAAGQPAGEAPDGPAILKDLDAALALLAAAEPAARRPYLALRLRAMERLGADGAQTAAWLGSRAGDPAAADLLPPAEDGADPQAPAPRKPGDVKSGDTSKPAAAPEAPAAAPVAPPAPATPGDPP